MTSHKTVQQKAKYYHYSKTIRKKEIRNVEQKAKFSKNRKKKLAFIMGYL